MSKPKILVFAPREEPPETIAALEGLGCELVFGNRDWQLPRRSDEEAVVEAARDASGRASAVSSRTAQLSSESCVHDRRFRFPVGRTPRKGPWQRPTRPPGALRS